MANTYRDIYEAVVTDVADPEKRGRVKVTCGAFAARDSDLPWWIEPMFPYVGANRAGFFFVPDVGTEVEIEVVTGRSDDDVPGLAMLTNAEVRWRCGIYKSESEVAEEFRKGYGKRLGLRTPKGQLLLFADDLQETILKFGKLRLGGEGSSENLVLGQVFRTYEMSLLDLIIAHTHQVGIGIFTGPPLNAASFASLKATPIADSAILSDVAFTQKD